MKKRVVLFFLLLCLCTSLVLPFAQAADDLFFVAVNDTVPLTLSADEKPYSAATGLYVPYTVFNCSPCGVAVSYNAATQTLVLFSTQKRLIFDIGKGTCTDESDQITDVLTTFKNGKLYIPISICASHFGLSYSVLISQSGYTVLRFTNGRQVYDDALFLEKAENLIAFRAENQQNETASGGADSSDDPAKEDEKTPIYFLICNAGQMPDAMEQLKKQGATAAFFLTADELRDHADLVRKLYAQGHTVGVTCAQDEPDVRGALREANEELDKILHVKTLFALTSSEQSAQLGGYFVFKKPAAAQNVTDVVRFAANKTFVCADHAVQDLKTAAGLGAAVLPLRETMNG